MNELDDIDTNDDNFDAIGHVIRAPDTNTRH